MPHIIIPPSHIILLLYVLGMSNVLVKIYFVQGKRPAVPVKAPDVKRTRRDRSELEDIMFKLFERQPNWTLKQLVQETDQPAVHIIMHISSENLLGYKPITCS